MPSKEFLETYPLYKKYGPLDDNCRYYIEPNLDHLFKTAIKMLCPTCNSDQTFTMPGAYEILNISYEEDFSWIIFDSAYRCAHCEEYERHFITLLDRDNNFMMKVGQYPSWEIKSDPEIDRLLGEYASLYKKGLVCESQSYGIAAFSYYRRIVELIIGKLLEQIPALLSEDENIRYEDALEKTRKTQVASEKIALVKDLLLPILRPDGMNPLALLHSKLSEGIHSESDEECLEIAAELRLILVFLVNQIARTKQASMQFTTSMRKMLNKGPRKPRE